MFNKSRDSKILNLKYCYKKTRKATYKDHINFSQIAMPNLNFDWFKNYLYLGWLHYRDDFKFDPNMTPGKSQSWENCEFFQCQDKINSVSLHLSLLSISRLWLVDADDTRMGRIISLVSFVLRGELNIVQHIWV